MKDKERIVVIGDIHGCIDEFDEMLKLADVKSPNVRVILLGDILDRGPDSLGCLRRARELNLESVLGNHDLKFIKWFRSPKDKPLYDHRKFYSEFNDDDINYIHRMPLYLKLRDNFIAVHAGVKPGVPLEKQKQDVLCYLRYTDKDRNFLSLKKVFKEKVSGAMFWTEFGSFGYNVVYGHNVHSQTTPEITRYDDGTACYGIDTGCVFGGKLSALILSDKEPEIVQVQAKEIYYKSDYLNDNGA